MNTELSILPAGVRPERVAPGTRLARDMADALHAWEQAPGFLRFLKERPGDATAVRRRVERHLSDARTRVWAALSADGAILGTCALFAQAPDPAHGRLMEASIRTNPAFTGKGVSTLLVRHACADAFDQGACDAVDGWHSAFNAGSRRVFEKSGFGLAGFFPDQTELPNIPGEGPQGGTMTHDLRWVLRADGTPATITPEMAAAMARALSGLERLLPQAA